MSCNQVKWESSFYPFVRLTWSQNSVKRQHKTWVATVSMTIKTLWWLKYKVSKAASTALKQRKDQIAQKADNKLKLMSLPGRARYTKWYMNKAWMFFICIVQVRSKCAAVQNIFDVYRLPALLLLDFTLDPIQRILVVCLMYYGCFSLTG